MTTSDDRTVAELIRAAFPDLTRAERQLADAILEDYPISGLGSITALSESSGVSTPTVLRMARKLGFDGFTHFQASLRGELKMMISDPVARREHWTDELPHAHILNRFAEAVSDNLRKTLQRMNVETFDAATALLADPDHAVFVVGGRVTRSLADYFFSLLQVIREGAHLLPPNANIWPHSVLSMKEGDVLLIFDIRRYERELLSLAKMARARGVTIVLMTDQWGSPITAQAAHAFHARIEVPSAWDSTVVLTYLVEALLAGIQALHWDTARRRMTELEGLLDETSMFKKFT